MIHVLAVTKEKRLLTDIPLERLADPDIAWYWVDFDRPTGDEVRLLSGHFHFHPLAIEDCLHFLQRPKLDYYDGYTFFVLHAVNQGTLEAEEVDLFLADNYVVSYHGAASEELALVRQRLAEDEGAREKGPCFLAYLAIDQLVDHYFPCLYKIEDQLLELDNAPRKHSSRMVMNRVFDLRGDLLTLRRTIVPMRDLLYRMLSSEHLPGVAALRVYFADVYDHLLKLTEMIESNREVTADIRDSHLSITSYRTSSIMMTLTVITTIFMPLTFIAGIYGMNFDNMPELHWRYGYFAVLAAMAVIGCGMYWWFKRKGWFDQDHW